jgi:hypothetical protein
MQAYSKEVAIILAPAPASVLGGVLSLQSSEHGAFRRLLQGYPSPPSCAAGGFKVGSISIIMPSLRAVSLRKDTSFLNDVGANHFFLPLTPSKGGYSGFPPLEGVRGRAVQNLI